MRTWSPPENLLPLPDPVPRGIRTPNGLVWASSREDFYKHDGLCWSKSMIQELKKSRTKHEEEDDALAVEPEVPHVLHPWRVLKSAKASMKRNDAILSPSGAGAVLLADDDPRSHQESNRSLNTPTSDGEVNPDAFKIHNSATVVQQSCKPLEVPDSMEVEDSGIDVSFDEVPKTNTCSHPMLGIGEVSSVLANCTQGRDAAHTQPRIGATLQTSTPSVNATRDHRRDSGIDMSADDELLDRDSQVMASGYNELVNAPQENHEEPPSGAATDVLASCSETKAWQEGQDEPTKRQSFDTNKNETPQKHGTEDKLNIMTHDIEQKGGSEESVIMVVAESIKNSDYDEGVECDEPGVSTMSSIVKREEAARRAEEMDTEEDLTERGDQDAGTISSAVPETKGANIPESTHPEEKPHLPKLAEFLPPGCFPEALIVNDPNGHTCNHSQSRSSTRPTGIKYKRLFPPLERPDIPETLSDPLPPFPVDEQSPLLTGYLDLNMPALGEGNHSSAYQAILRLPESLALCGPVLVAAKISSFSTEDLEMLYNEGYFYNRCPKHLQEDWSGYNHLKETEYHNRDGVFPALAVVPKFYGLYIPIQEDDEAVSIKGKRDLIRDWQLKNLSPILLVEECGEPIERGELRGEDRALLFSFVARLHHEGMYQGSFYVRNILRQPGPLHVPPGKRTNDTPSFRLIDFGRGRFKDNWTQFYDGFSSWSTYYNEAIRQSKNAIFGYLDSRSCRPYW